MICAPVGIGMYKSSNLDDSFKFWLIIRVHALVCHCLIITPQNLAAGHNHMYLLSYMASTNWGFKSDLGLWSLEGLTGAEAPPLGCWWEALFTLLVFEGLSSGLFKHPYNMVAGFPQNDGSKKARLKPQYLLWLILQSQILPLLHHLPGHLCSCGGELHGA